MARLTLPGLSLPGITADQAGKSKLAQWGPTIAMVVLVAIAAWLATRWFWHFWPQQPAAANVARTERAQPIAQVAETIAAAQLFGAAAQPVTQVATSTMNVKLKGVFAGGENKPAAAILNAGQKDEFVRTGNEVAPGVTLDAVFPTHVLIKRSGRLERVNLEERIEGGGGAPRPGAPPARRIPPPPPAASTPNVPSVQPVPPAGQQVPPPFPPVAPPAGGPTPGLAPGMPSGGGMPMQQGSGGNFGSVVPTSAGVTVQSAPPGSILANIGLQQGDVIKSVNGQAVSGTGDLARLYGQTANGQTVAGEIIRGGQTVPITITVRR